VVVNFPISERTQVVNLVAGRYTYTLRGTTVISVSPKTSWPRQPLFDRLYYRGSPVMKTVERFVYSEPEQGSESSGWRLY